MKLIDKDTLVAEIKKRIEAHKETLKNCDSSISEMVLKGSMSAYQSLLHFLNILEMKEVDLNEAARHYLLHEHISPLNEVLHQADLKVEMQYHKDIEDAYKAGLKLKLSAQSSSVWHQVSEEIPTKFGESIIIASKNKNKEDGIWLYDLIQSWEGEWSPRVNWETPVKWAYMDDLIK